MCLDYLELPVKNLDTPITPLQISTMFLSFVLTMFFVYFLPLAKPWFYYSNNDLYLLNHISIWSKTMANYVLIRNKDIT